MFRSPTQKANLKKPLFLTLLLFGILGLGMSGCGILIGNVRPVEDKSKDYRVLDLGSIDSDWEKISEKPVTEDADVSDISYQSRKTSATISLNTACRPSLARSETPLETLLKNASKELVLGLDELNVQEQNFIKIKEIVSLQSLLSAKMGKEQVKIKTVVLKNASCLFDIMYISKPETFDSQISQFSQFVDSLNFSK